MAVERDLDWIIGRYVSSQPLDADERSWLDQKIKEDPELAEFIEELIWQEKIEAYQKGELNAEAQADFERALQNNEQLKAVWAQHQITAGAFELKRRYRHMELFNQTDPPEGKQREKRKSNGWKGYLLVFGLLILTGVIYLYLNEGTELPGNSPDMGASEEILDESEPSTTTPEEPSNSENDTDSETQEPDDEEPFEQEIPIDYLDSIRQSGRSNIQAAAVFLTNESLLGPQNVGNWEGNFSSRQYDQVINLLNPRRDSLLNASATRELFYLAISMLLSSPGSSESCENGNELFQEILQQPDSHQGRYLEQVRWYSAMSLICMDRLKDAIPIIEDIVNGGDHPYKLEAQRLYDHFQNYNN